MKDVDYLFHVAAVFKHWSKNEEKDIIEPNKIGSENIIEAAAEAKIKKIVYGNSGFLFNLCCYFQLDLRYHKIFNFTLQFPGF
ncbi:MAG: NAD-dependent epimerase/dehydratase family protein [Desulfobacterales bacterium]|nr:NAD-dependent epimerase/dehydratase family protein [Desulfobacterales bacterium]MCP4162859.1 NAD-dependent epimerase/dehydratase family protein [Deltaproteobacteria bacterium]